MIEQSCQATGGCLCGAVRYELSARPVFTAICHCRNCQRQTGSAFSIVTGYPAAAYSQTGESSIFVDRGASGRPVERHFCGRCGSALLSRIEPLPELVLIKSGTLDDVAGLDPVVEVFCASRMSFLPELPGTETFERSNV